MNDDHLVPGNSCEDPKPAKMLANILLLTEKMLEEARRDAWDTVTELEEERRGALNACFSEPIPLNQEDLFSQALAAMLHMNEEMIGLLEAAKENVAIKRTDQKHVNRSLGHYLDIEKSH